MLISPEPVSFAGGQWVRVSIYAPMAVGTYAASASIAPNGLASLQAVVLTNPAGGGGDPPWAATDGTVTVTDFADFGVPGRSGVAAGTVEATQRRSDQPDLHVSGQWGCVAPMATATTLLTLSGTGDKNSQPFRASGDTAYRTYTFDCTSHGSAGHFALTFLDRNGVTLETVNDTLATSGKSGADHQTIYLSNTAGPYHLSIRSDCAWSVTVTVTGTP